MHGLLSFESDKNAFVAIGTFGFSVPLAVLKNRLDGGRFGGPRGSWKKRAHCDPCEIRRQCLQ